MRECTEKIIKVGFTKSPKKLFDEVEMITAEMIRQGWFLKDSLIEDGLGYMHLFFERDIDIQDDLQSIKGDFHAV